MNWPAFFSRKYLRAAFVTIIVPKRFVSICARNSDRGVSSTDERLPYPALLMTTSSEPNSSTAANTAFAAAASSVTSIAKSLTCSPYRSERSDSDLMSRAVANTLLPAARPASTIARPRPRELPVTNHTCAIHPPLSSHPPYILEKLLKLRIGCAMGIRKDLLVTEEIAESSDLRATPFEFERAKSVEAALSILEGKWKIVILNRLFARPVWRFSELERAVPGISQRMLSQQLRLLEKCELVKRTVHPQFPP